MPNILKRIRARAFRHQNGCCIYCDKPMWLIDPADFATKQNITFKQARRFQCTAEHLWARKNGGSDVAANIAAACLHCNQRRHMRKAQLTPEQYKCHVRKKLSRGGWQL